MNAERLHAIADALYSEMQLGEIPDQLTVLRDAARQSANEPGNAGPQERLAGTRSTLRAALEAAPSNGFSPAWREALGEMGIDDLVGNALLQHIDEIFDQNAITPSTAADELDPLVDRVTQLYSALDQVRSGLTHLLIGAEELDPGEVEIGFVIPRQAIKEDLEQLGKEFIQLQQILGPFLEIETGSRDAVRVRTISSSSFAAFLESAPGVALTLSTVVAQLIGAYKNVQEIRENRSRMKESGAASAKTLKSMEDDAEALMGKAIGEITTEVLKQAKGVDPGRRHELTHEVKVSLNALANRIDLGYTIEVRVGELPPPEDDDEGPGDKAQTKERELVEKIKEKQESLKFTNLTGTPILSLPEPKDSISTTPTHSKPTRRGAAKPKQKPVSDGET